MDKSVWIIKESFTEKCFPNSGWRHIGKNEIILGHYDQDVNWQGWSKAGRIEQQMEGLC